MTTNIGAEAGDTPQTPDPANREGSSRSGEGTASALARVKTQHEHRARQQPADEPGEHRKQP